MRVNIHEPIDVSDDQRVQIADILDGKVSKRQASRQEIKTFVWQAGACWDLAIESQWSTAYGPSDSDIDDLLGATDDDDPSLEDLL